MPKKIDYLFEDPAIEGQSFALVSIVGPHMPQKCDVWGLKVRGVARTLESAKDMTAKLMKIDNHYDIYTVDVGKFFPLAVEPLQLKNVEYQNEALNSLIKSYLENRERANDEWHSRKNQMIQDAIKEGASQSNKSEHPVAVLGRIRNLNTKIEDLKEQLTEALSSKEEAESKFNAFSEEEKECASRELDSAIQNAVRESGKENIQVEEVKEELTATTTTEIRETGGIESILEEIKLLEEECNDLRAVRGKPVIEKTLKEYEEKLEELRKKLGNAQLVNDFIKKNYQKESQHSVLFE